MSLLLPELERQLRAAARARRGSEQRPLRRERLRPSALALATALALALVAVIVVSAIGGGRTSASAAALERAALAAQRGLAAPSLAPGQYWYTRTIQASTTGVSFYGAPAPASAPAPGAGARLRRLPAPALIQTRELQEAWVRTDGSGRVRNVTESPARFFGAPADRLRWQAGAARAPGPVPVDETLPGGAGYRSPLGPLSYAQVLALPTDPAAMLARIRAAALSSQREIRRLAPGSPLAEQSLTQAELQVIAGALVDLPLKPAARAAVYRAMKYLPGVTYTADVRDPLGRRGAALSSPGSIAFIDASGALSGRRRVTDELVFDLRSGALLAQQSLLDQPIPSVGLPAGYPVQYSAYVVSASVDTTAEGFASRTGVGRPRLLAVPSTPSCESAGPPAPRLVGAPIPSTFLHDFSVLRRPGEMPARLLGRIAGGEFGFELAAVFRSSIHLVRSTPGGARDYMLVGYRAAPPPLGPRRCLPGLSSAQYRHDVQAQRRARHAKPQAVLCVFELGGSLGFSCLSPADVDSIDYATSDYGRPPATVTGIVPDGVAAVQASYPDGRRVDAPVAHNLLIYRVGLPAPGAQPSAVAWIDARGHVIRRLRASSP